MRFLDHENLPRAAVPLLRCAQLVWARIAAPQHSMRQGLPWGATVGRRLPAGVLRAVIVVVGLTALVTLLWP